MTETKAEKGFMLGLKLCCQFCSVPKETGRQKVPNNGP